MQTPIRILETDLTLVAEIDNYEELTFTRKLYRAGNFKLIINYDVNNASELTKNRLIMLGAKVNKVGIIKEIKYTIKNNRKTLDVRGFELKGVFSQRITIPTAAQAHQSFSATEIETIMKDVVQRNCIDIAANKFDNLTIASDLARGSQEDFNTRYKNLEDELEKIGRVGGIGTKVYLNFSTGKWVFDIIEGTDRTTGQAIVDPVIFSSDYDNIKTQTYIDSDLFSGNYAYIGGQGIGAARTIEEVGGAETDVEKYVVFVDARDLNASADLIARGNEKLTKIAAIQTFDCEILPNNTFVYETDWDLGDIITIQDKELGITLDRRIESITEYYESRGFFVEVTFGDENRGIKQYIDNSTDVSVE